MNSHNNKKRVIRSDQESVKIWETGIVKYFTFVIFEKMT